MAKANTVGELMNEGLLFDKDIADGDDPIVIVSPTLFHLDGLSFQLATGDLSRTIVVAEGDSVDESSKTWIFANGGFTAADVGATFTVTGATDPDNNGDFTVASVTNGTTVVSSESPGGDETLDPEAVTVTITDVTLGATFTVEVSNDFVRATLPGLSQIPFDGTWADVTSKFANTGSPFFPSIAAIAAPGGPWYQMYPLMARAVRWTITPTAGAGHLKFWFAAKGNR